MAFSFTCCGHVTIMRSQSTRGGHARLCLGSYGSSPASRPPDACAEPLSDLDNCMCPAEIQARTPNRVTDADVSL